MFRVISLTCAAAVMCWAQSAALPASITAVGSSSISVPPDLARVDVGVYTQAATAQAASQANATLANTVIMALQSLLGSSASIQTVNYSLSPVYNSPALGQPATIIGFSVNNTVEATLTDLSKIGSTVDTAIQNGANSVLGISFDLQDRNPPTAQALKTASASAMSQAAAIAAGLNVHTGSVLHASEGVNVTPVLTGIVNGTPVAAPVTTPVQTGLVIIQASVTLEVALTP